MIYYILWNYAFERRKKMIKSKSEGKEGSRSLVL